MDFWEMIDKQYQRLYDMLAINGEICGDDYLKACESLDRVVQSAVGNSEIEVNMETSKPI